jgi:hypothetical protein
MAVLTCDRLAHGLQAECRLYCFKGS